MTALTSMDMPSPFRKTPKVEPDFDQTFRTWQQAPTPELNSQMLRQVQPLVTDAIKAHVGSDDPLMRGRARVMTLEALRKFDPRKASLKTYLFQQLQPLKRYARKQLEPVPVPERDYYARIHAHNSAKELEDRLGREPTISELADETGMSRDRLARLRTQGAIPASAITDRETGETLNPGVRQGDTMSAAVDLLYDDLHPTDQKILEWTLGLYGTPKLSNQDIAARLGRTPGAISQRKALIQQQLNKLAAADLI